MLDYCFDHEILKFSFEYPNRNKAKISFEGDRKLIENFILLGEMMFSEASKKVCNENNQIVNFLHRRDWELYQEKTHRISYKAYIIAMNQRKPLSHVCKDLADEHNMDYDYLYRQSYKYMSEVFLRKQRSTEKAIYNLYLKGWSKKALMKKFDTTYYIVTSLIKSRGGKGFMKKTWNGTYYFVKEAQLLH